MPPIAVPMTRARTVAESAIPRSIRGAAMTRLKTSMPTSSVPNQCAPLGARSCWPALACIGG